MSVTVYTRTGCIQCTMTKKALDRRGAAYEQIDLDQHPELIDGLKERGFMALPIVQHGEDWWGGFRPDKIATVPGGQAPTRGQDLGASDAPFRRQPALSR